MSRYVMRVLLKVVMFLIVMPMIMMMMVMMMMIAAIQFRLGIQPVPHVHGLGLRIVKRGVEQAAEIKGRVMAVKDRRAPG